MEGHGRHSAPEEPRVIEGEVLDRRRAEEPAPEPAPTRRRVPLVLGVLLLQMAFIGAYAGAWHSPTPHRLPIALVTSPAVEQFQAQVERHSDAVSAQTFTQRDDAFAALRQQDVYAVLVAGLDGQVELHVASATGGSAAETLAQLYGRFALSTGVPVQVYDDVALPASDSRGLTPFVLVVGWVIGGYLLALVLGRRMLALLASAVVSAAGGVLLVGPVLGIWHAHLVALGSVGLLVVFGAAATSAVLVAAFSAVGTGVTLLLLLALGYPAAGGLFVPELTPQPFRALHDWLLPAAGTTAARSVVYFGGHGSVGAYLVLSAWCALGAASHYLIDLARAARSRVGSL